MRIKIDTADLVIGMFVAELDRPWLDSPFLFQGFVIEDEAELLQLRQVCRWVKVDDTKSKASVNFDQVQVASAERQAQDFVTVAKQTAKLAERAVDQVDKLLDSARLGHSVEPADAHEVVSGLVHSVTSNTNAALWLTSLKKRNARAAGHCLNVSILSLAFAQYLGEPIDEMQQIGMGALMHDIGLGKVPQFILNKAVPLVEGEREVIEQHPAEGHRMMTSTRQLPPKALQIIQDHHERIDGSGYPRGLKGGQIDRSTLIVAIADTYDSLTTDQPWRKAMLPQLALTKMHKECGDALGQDLVQKFIKCLGIYPIGSLVRLSTGALGVVLSSDEESRLKPMVMLVKDVDGSAMLPHKIVNLQTIAKSRPQDPWLITELLDPSQHGIDVQAVIASEIRM